MIAAAIMLAACRAGAPVRVEVYSNWTTGPQAVGLEALSDRFHAEHPEAVLVNIALSSQEDPAGGAAIISEAQAFQNRVGRDFIQERVISGQVLPLDEIYRLTGLRDTMPKALLELVSYEGHPYAVPVDLHSANVLFYNVAVLRTHGIEVASLQGFESWQQAAQKLAAAGIVPLALGDSEPSSAALLFETVLLGSLGPEKYQRLWTGATSWGGPEVAQALHNFGMMLDYANPDHSALTWDQANQYVIEGKAAMTIAADWGDADYIAKGFDGYGWTSPPGNLGVFDAFGDSFSLNAATANAELPREFLKLLGSRDGQQTLNQIQGALCARTDCDYTSFGPFWQAAGAELNADKIVPSVVGGAAIPDAWRQAYIAAVAAFVKDRDVGKAQAALASACRNAGACQ